MLQVLRTTMSRTNARMHGPNVHHRPMKSLNRARRNCNSRHVVCEETGFLKKPGFLLVLLSNSLLSGRRRIAKPSQNKSRPALYVRTAGWREGVRGESHLRGRQGPPLSLRRRADTGSAPAHRRQADARREARSKDRAASAVPSARCQPGPRRRSRPPGPRW